MTSHDRLDDDEPDAVWLCDLAVSDEVLDDVLLPELDDWTWMSEALGKGLGRTEVRVERV